ncbi:unnamed protein product [Scytosiphon promiscuus]
MKRRSEHTPSHKSRTVSNIRRQSEQSTVRRGSMRHRPVLCLILARWIGAVSGRGDHGGPEHLALYSMGVGGSYTLQLEAVGEEDNVEFMVVPSSSADLEGLEIAEEESTPAWDEFSSGSEAPTSITGSSSVVPSRSVVYTVSLLSGELSPSSSSASPTNTATATATGEATVVAVPVAIAEAGAYTLLVNHGEIPTELVSPEGETLVPIVTEEGNGHHDAHEEDEEAGDDEEGEEEGDEDAGSATARQWANALGAAFLISLCSFVGIATVASHRITQKINLSLALLFASGALLTTAVVHIIPEAMEELALEHPDDLHGIFLRSGTTVMGGILVGFLLHVALDNGSAHSHSTDQLRLLSVPGRGSGGTPGGSTKSTNPSRDGDGDIKEHAALSVHASGNGTGHPINAEPAAVEPRPSEVTNGGDRVCAGDHSVGSTSATGSGHGAAVAAEESPACAGPAEAEEGRPRGSDPVEGTVLGGKRGFSARPPCAVPGREERVAAGGVVKPSRPDGKGPRAERGLFDVAGLDPICWNVIVGDFAHNFSDGVTMAAAFLGCSSTVGWTITAANMMHEIPHELGNFISLVNGGMSVKQALLYNFFSALFAVLGVLLTFSLRDLISSTLISYLLLLGAGTFIFVGLAEIVPDAVSFSATAATTPPANRERFGDDADRHANGGSHRRAQVRKALAFTVGAVLLGLPLLFHKHCDADGTHGHEHR